MKKLLIIVLLFSSCGHPDFCKLVKTSSFTCDPDGSNVQYEEEIIMLPYEEAQIHNAWNEEAHANTIAALKAEGASEASINEYKKLAPRIECE
jgi:hypothetical protein